MQNDVILLLEENKRIRHENELLRKFFLSQMSFKAGEFLIFQIFSNFG